MWRVKASREVLVKLLKQSALQSYSKADRHFLAVANEQSGVAREFRPQTILDLNPFLARAWDARDRFNRICKMKYSASARSELNRFLDELPVDVRRSCHGVVRSIRKWQELLLASLVVPGLDGYSSARSSLERELQKKSTPIGPFSKRIALVTSQTTSFRFASSARTPSGVGR
jgi:hypothetical protein